MSKCSGDDKYDCRNDSIVECRGCKKPLCYYCVVTKWMKCNECSAKERKKENYHLLKNNVNPSYYWVHTQNNDGKTYVSKAWLAVNPFYFKTLNECIANIKEFRKFLTYGNEVILNMTYIVTYWIDTKYTDEGIVLSGTRVREMIYTPSEIRRFQLP